MDSYLDAIDGQQGDYILLAGQSVFVKRARLGLHLRLATIADELDRAGTASEKTTCMAQYFDRYSMDVRNASAIETVEAFLILRHLNQWQMAVPWLVTPPGWSAPPLPPFHYPQRWWATWVHEIASRYGWTRSEILNLWPEEVALYLQEIQVSEFNEIEDRRALSEVSYEYNSSTKKSKFRPMPKPGWMMDESLPAVIKVNSAVLPVGAIVPM